MSDRLRLLGDRAAWLRKEAPDLRTRVLADQEYAAEYWANVEATVAWVGHIGARRAREMRDRLTGKRGRK